MLKNQGKDKMTGVVQGKPEAALEISKAGIQKWKQANMQGSIVENSNIIKEPREKEKSQELLNIEDEKRKLREVELALEETQKSFAGKETKENVKKKNKVIEQLRQVMEEQEQEYKERELRAKEVAAQSSKKKTQIEHDSMELVMMLESFRRKEEIEQQKESSQNNQNNGRKKVESNNMKDKMEVQSKSVKSIAMEKEQQTDKAIESIDEKGTEHIQLAKDLSNNFSEEGKRINEALEDTSYTNEEKISMVNDYLDRAKETLGEVRDNRQGGIREKQNARDIKRIRKGNQNMAYANRAQDSIDKYVAAAELDDVMRNVLKEKEEAKREQAEEKIEVLQKSLVEQEEDMEKELQKVKEGDD